MTDHSEELHAVSGRALFSEGESCVLHFPIIGVRDVMERSVDAGPKPAPAAAELPHVAIVDSHCLTRECITNGIANLFEGIKLSSFFSVHECNHQKASRFSLVVLHLHASEHQPLDRIRSLRSANPNAVVFLISDVEYQTDPEFIRSAWRLGTRGFVSTKATSLTLALSAISFIQAGGFFFAPADEPLSLPHEQRASSPGPPPPSDLTARETLVLRLLKQGKTNKMIAKEIGLSSNTVKVHVHNILRKMNAKTRTEAASRSSPTISSKDGTAMMLS